MTRGLDPGAGPSRPQVRPATDALLPAPDALPPVLAEVDVDGALGEAAARVWTGRRVDVLLGAVVGSAALTGLVAEPADAAGRRHDRAILNFALLLEHLQADFYSEAERLGSLRDETRRQARTVGAHERAHVAALRGVLGGDAIRKPSFDFGAVTARPAAFRRTAVAFEDLSVAAYAGQLARIRDRQYRATAAGILTVEARHAAWIRRLASRQPAAGAFDRPQGAAQVRRVVARTGFIRRTPKTASRRRPRFTG